MSSVLCLLKKSRGRDFLDKIAGETRRLIFLLILSVKTPNTDLKKTPYKRSGCVSSLSVLLDYRRHLVF